MHEIHPRLSINSLCFSGAGIADIIESWHRLSPAIVSFRSNLLLEETSDALQAAIRREEYRVETISHTFISGYPTTFREHWPSARRTLCELIELARRVGAGSIYMLTGGHGPETWEISAQAFCEALSPCLPQARDVDIDILIEPAPMLYADAHLAHTLRDTLLLAEMADIGICIDIFSSWAEAGLKQTINRAISRTKLVQIGDYVLGDRAMPCRAVPGEGAIPLTDIIHWILDAGYTGNFDLELLGPRIDAFGHVEAAKSATLTVGAIIDAHRPRADR